MQILMLSWVFSLKVLRDLWVVSWFIVDANVNIAVHFIKVRSNLIL